MNTGKNKVSLLQFVLMIHGVQMGVRVLSLPGDVAEKSGTDGWIPIIIYWMLATLVSIIIIQVMKRYPDGTILELVHHYFGKWIAKIAALVFAGYFALIATIIFIREALFIQAWVLVGMNTLLIFVLLSVPSYLIVRRNIVILARYAEIVFFISVWMLLVYLITLKDAEWLYLLPVLKEGWEPIFKTLTTVTVPFFGFEVLYFLYPYLENKEKAVLGAVLANTLSCVVFLIITVSAFVFFSPGELNVYNEPSIVMLKVLEFRFIERLEIALFSLYLFTISTTVLPYMFLTVFCTSRLFGRKDHSKFLPWFFLFTFLSVIIFPPTVEQNKMMHNYAEKYGLMIAIALPIVLWGIVSLKQRFSKGAVQ